MKNDVDTTTNGRVYIIINLYKKGICMNKKIINLVCSGIAFGVFSTSIVSEILPRLIINDLADLLFVASYIIVSIYGFYIRGIMLGNSKAINEQPCLLNHQMTFVLIVDMAYQALFILKLDGDEYSYLTHVVFSITVYMASIGIVVGLAKTYNTNNSY